jgi:tetratricopeptide (TPR) repeat protein
MLDRQHHYEDAHQALLVLRANSNYREFYGEIDLELGNVARDRGDVLSALSQYAYVDTAYARTEPSADANLALGMLYETVLMQYDSARVVYDRGRQAVNTSLSKAQIVRRADYVARYITYRNDIIKLDSLRYAALHPPDTLAARRDSLPVRKDSLIAPKAVVKADTSAAGRMDTTRARLPVAPPLSLDTINVRLAGRMDDIAGLFYATIGLRDSARYWYHRLLAEYPGYRAVPRALYVLARIENEDSTGTHAAVDSLYRDLIVRFPGSPFAEEAKRILGLPATVKAPDPLEISYTNATSLLQSGMGGAAIDSFRAIVRRSPSSVFAPRAQYAVAWTYEYQVQQMDSAAANYERLVALYPGTVYAQRVQPRMTEMQAARQAALAPKKPDTTAIVPPGKVPDKVPEVPEEEGMSKRRREKPNQNPGTEKTDTPIEIPDDRVLR